MKLICIGRNYINHITELKNEKPSDPVVFIKPDTAILLKKQPFFMALGFLKPHLPFNAPKKYWDLYDKDDIVLPLNNFFPPNAPQKANYFYELRKFTDIPEKGAISDDKAKELIHAYYACVSYIDAQIGLILDELKSQGLSNNTTVVLTSDHGFSLSEHGRWTKHNLFQYELKIPMIISSPKYKKNKTSESFVELIDLYATFCDLAEIETPDFVQGKSLVSNLKNPNKVSSEIAFSIWRNGENLISNIKGDGNKVFSGEAGKMASKSGNKALVTAFGAMRMIVTVGWAIYPLGYVFGYLTGGVDADSLNVIYNIADLLNKTAFGLIIWAAAVQSGGRKAK